MNINFYMPTEIISGYNCIDKNKFRFNDLGKKCIIITGKSAAKKSGALFDVENALKSEKIEYIIFDGIKENPLMSDCIKAAKKAIEFFADFVVGIGGGSPLDAAKAVSVFAKNENLMEEEITGEPWTERLKIALVGTSAGTGTEANPYAVLTQGNGKKATFSTKNLYPEISFCDYKYTKTLNETQTMHTALDTVAHLIEGYFSKKATDISDMFALEGLKISYKAFRKILEAENFLGIMDDAMRENLYKASIYGGFVINTAGTLFPHPLGYRFTEEMGISHGAACNLFFPEFVDWCEENSNDKYKKLLCELGIDKNLLFETFQNHWGFSSGFSGNTSGVAAHGFITSPDYYEEIVEDKKDTPNFLNTPGNFTKEAALELFKKKFPSYKE